MKDKKNISQSKELAIVRKFYSYNEATIYKSLLDSAGVESRLLNDASFSVLPLQNELTEIFLVVNIEDAEKAAEVLSADFDHKEFDEESE